MSQVANRFEVHMKEMQLREKALNAEGIKVFRLSTTERQEFKECRRKWDFSSYSRQALEPDRPALALWFGTGVHYVLEKFYMDEQLNYGTPEASVFSITDCWNEWVDLEIAKVEKSQKGLWPEQIQELRDSVALGEKMLLGYINWAAKEDHHGGVPFKQILFTEEEFAVPLKSEDGAYYRFKDANEQQWELWLVGRIDLIIQDTDNRIWVLDHKTSKDKLDKELLTLDDQMTMYIWAIQQILEVQIAGCLYNVLRKKIPSIPRVLKAGGLSKDKSIDTTYDVYLSTIYANDLDPADYQEILSHLSEKNSQFFERVAVKRNQHEIAMAGRMVLMEGIDMLNAPYIYPNPTWDCGWKCDFKQLCLATNRNDDVAYLKTTLYRTRVPEEKSVYARESTVE